MKITMNHFFNVNYTALALPALLAVALRPDAAVLTVICVWVASLLSFRVYSRQSWATKAGRAVMIAAATLLGCGVVINQWYFTAAAGGTDAAPVLMNTDALDYWTRATGNFFFWFNDTHSGYPLLLRGIMLLHQGIAIPLAINMLATLLTIIIAGAIARRTLAPRFTHAATAAMVITAANCYFLVCGTLLLKDAFLNLLIPASALCMLRIRQTERPALRDILPLIGIFLAMALLRMPMVAMMCVGVVLLTRLDRPHIIASGVLLGVAASVLAILPIERALDTTVTTTNVGHTIELATGKVTAYSGTAEMQERKKPMRNLIGNFSHFSLAKRLLYLPAFCLLQFLIPYPWNYARDIIFGPTSAYAHFAYPGYIAGIVLGYYALWLMWRRRLQPVNLLLLWGALCYCAVALIWAGTVSRYVLPFIPLAAPAVAETLLGCTRRRSFWIWTGCCSALMAVGLLICHHLQTSA